MAQPQVTVFNETANDLFLGYLPPHGKLLPAGTGVTLNYDLTAVLAAGRNRFSRSRELAALQADILADRVSITDLAGSSL